MLDTIIEDLLSIGMGMLYNVLLSMYNAVVTFWQAVVLGAFGVF